MNLNIANRKIILESLRSEMVGPDPKGDEVDCSAALYFKDWSDANGPFRQKGSGEEILQKDTPRIRYGVGVLYPSGSTVSDLEQGESSQTLSAASPDDDAQTRAARDLAGKAEDNLTRIAERSEPYDEAAADDFSLASANQMQQSCIGLSFLVDLADSEHLVVEASGGQYLPWPVHIEAAERKINWWLRHSVSIKATFTARELNMSEDGPVIPASIGVSEGVTLDLRVEAFSRLVKGEATQRLVTIALVNRTKRTSSLDSACLFQSGFKVRVENEGQQRKAILAYPEAYQNLQDSEEQGIALLYRNQKTFAIGHGCSADWAEPDSPAAKTEIQATCLPQIEIPAITSDITRQDGSRLEVPMALLAGLISERDGFPELEEVIALYRDWISEHEKEIVKLPDELQNIARNHIALCLRASERMENGLKYLRRPDQKNRALRAFRLANHAILLQQINGSKQRQTRYNAKSKRLEISPAYDTLDFSTPSTGRGNWRAFQIAFMLLSLASVADVTSPERDIVELIWFPTGGGKTEAYLGLSAFAMFLRRIDNPGDNGVQVLMRYTLRLLTAQQFQRAAGLICAMDRLRRDPDNTDMGENPFSIGIWVGGDTTPNNFDQARERLRKLRTNPRAENPFLITRCPWCGAYLGQLKEGNLLVRDLPVVGYEENGKEVMFRCPDRSCPFGKKVGLPVHVVDEGIYQQAPSLVIGTVDKFAQLAWKPEARRLFGFDDAGNRVLSPPDLIIQDELHLIAGPLGSMVGLYETLIEEMCTDRRPERPVPPKIVCSTATIRRFEDQILALYNRRDAVLFPPPGLDAGDSFFATYSRDKDRNLSPGKIYVGIHAPALGSMLTTQVRVNSALLQAPVDLSPGEADPWWTLLIFFNSIRELGGALTLFQADIPERIGQMRLRMGREFGQMRRLWRIEELTSRLRNDEVPEAIQKLQEVFQGKPGTAVDICLASNIIEVGVDIDRLSLMAVVGQPKTTSQYIQVTGRVGRRQEERPGIVVTIYNPSKPRDRSHFEKFRSYHERLYAQVEPTSVTPFSPPLLDRALHALMVAYVRQLGDRDEADSPSPCPEAQLREFWTKILQPRVKSIDPAEEVSVRAVVQRRADEWKQWKPGAWRASKTHPYGFLMRAAGEYIPADVENNSWPTPTSLRNVDAECQAQITQLYMEQSSTGVLLDDAQNNGTD